MYTYNNSKAEMETKRAYETTTGKFGTIVKSSGILGLKNTIAIVFDDGAKKAFFGKSLDSVVCVSDDCDDIPVDLVHVWKSSLKADQSTDLIKAFVQLNTEEQDAVRTRWVSTTKRSRSKFTI